MASVFTYDPEPPRVSSPWSTPRSSNTPKPLVGGRLDDGPASAKPGDLSDPSASTPASLLDEYGISKLAPEPQEGPTEYKLHLLLRPRRFSAPLSGPHSSSGLYRGADRSGASSINAPDDGAAAVSQAAATHARQHRLQQLTTQLLWRLQQSSPYHSSSTAELVIPVLPDSNATLQLPSHMGKLLPGLEESQGALYEIGVADDGTFVGLLQDELDESLLNLKAMAASLGCRVQVLRTVAVGDWVERTHILKTGTKHHAETLWVAEALVKPDMTAYRSGGSSVGEVATVDDVSDAEVTNHSNSHHSKGSGVEEAQSSTEQLRISLTGATTSGKSSLLGTLSSSTLDNGRGKSRLSLLKHRHEIASGLTSSVAQELLGYRNRQTAERSPAALTEVINYASGNVSAWSDIHATSEAGRLVFLSDSAGHPRYRRTTVRGLMSWAPHWTFLCVAADDGESAGKGHAAGATASTQDILGSAGAGVDLSLAHLELCMKLDLALVLVITKFDLASKSGLRQTLSKMLTSLKAAGRKPQLLSTAVEAAPPDLDLQHVAVTDLDEVSKLLASDMPGGSSVVPIILTSSVTGAGIGKVHALLSLLPIPRVQAPSAEESETPSVLFHIDDVYTMPPHKVFSLEASELEASASGLVASGHLRYGQLTIGDELVVGPLIQNIDARETATPPIVNHSKSLPNYDGSYTSSPDPRNLQDRHLAGEMRRQASHSAIEHVASSKTQGLWQRARIVSIRDLRLPVRRLLAGQAGTIGLMPLDDASAGLRVRKGMVLANLSTSDGSDLPSYTGFQASFHDTSTSSFILGSQVVVYIASIRTSARVVHIKSAVEPAAIPTDPSSSSDAADADDVFGFDGEDSESGEESANTKGATVVFQFLASREWFEKGVKVLVMPEGVATAAAARLESFAGVIDERFG